jgi:hypothetical protein
MRPDSERVRRFLARSMIARVATITPAGRPRITPLWFVTDGGTIVLNCRTESPAARDILANGDVVMLFAHDRGHSKHVLRLRGGASFYPGRQFSARTLLRFARKYYLTVGGVGSVLASLATLPARLRYYRERVGEAGAIEFLPETAEFISAP